MVFNLQAQERSFPSILILTRCEPENISEADTRDVSGCKHADFVCQTLARRLHPSHVESRRALMLG